MLRHVNGVRRSDSLVVGRLASVREGLESFAEGSHAVGKVSLLVLRDSELDVTENKLIIQVGRLAVVFCSILELVHDEKNWGTCQCWCKELYSLGIPCPL